MPFDETAQADLRPARSCGYVDGRSSPSPRCEAWRCDQYVGPVIQVSGDRRHRFECRLKQQDVDRSLVLLGDIGELGDAAASGFSPFKPDARILSSQYTRFPCRYRC
jgi:hypothetical protein